MINGRLINIGGIVDWIVLLMVFFIESVVVISDVVIIVLGSNDECL